MLLIDPRGEFPLDDDWAYTRSAFRLASGEGLRIDEWAAPSLVGQALYGGLLARCFGPHFLVLRLSTLALSCGIALLLWFTLLRLGIPSSVVWAAVLSWIFNPIQFWLSFTFMTEVPFLFFVSLGTFLFLRSTSTGNRRVLVACAAAFGYAFLIRQTAILFIAVVLILLAVGGNRTKLRDRIVRATVFALTAGSFVAAYPGLGNPGRRRDACRPTEVRTSPPHHSGTIERQLVRNSLLSLIHAYPFVDMPPSKALPAGTGIRREAIGRWFSGAWGAIAAYGLWWFDAHCARFPYLPAKAFHAQMPFLLNVLYDTGLGPVTLDPTYYGPPATPVHPGLWFAVTILTAIGVVILGCDIDARRAGGLDAKDTAGDSGPGALLADVGPGCHRL